MLQTAHRMARASEIAYLDDAMKQYADLGYTGHTFFDIDGAQCHAVWNDDEYALCFRGTEPSEIGDILADLNAIPRGANGLHAGQTRGSCGVAGGAQKCGRGSPSER